MLRGKENGFVVAVKEGEGEGEEEEEEEGGRVLSL